MPAPRDLLDEMLAELENGPPGTYGDQAAALLLLAREARALRRAFGDAVGIAVRLMVCITPVSLSRDEVEKLWAEYRKRFAATEEG